MDNFCQCPDVLKKVLEDDLIYLINLDENTYIVKENTDDVLTPYSNHYEPTKSISCTASKQSISSMKSRKTIKSIKSRAPSSKKRKYSDFDVEAYSEMDLSHTSVFRDLSSEYREFVQKVMCKIQINCQRDELVLQRLLYNAYDKWKNVPLNTICEVVQSFVCKDLKNVMEKRISKSKSVIRKEQYLTKEFIKILNTY